MASLSTDKYGRRSIQFVDASGRHTIRLGTLDKRAADAIRRHVERLQQARDHKQPPPRETAEWADAIDAKLHARLAKFNLIEARRAPESVELAKFLDGYIKRRTDLKPNTIENIRQVRNGLVAHLGKPRDIRTITRGEMLDWHRGLKAKYAGPTVAMHVKKARQVFGDALDRKLIAENPVRGIKAGSMKNADRFEYVPDETIARVIDATPDMDWKLIFALARYACLRVPSETSGLKWADILWDTGRMIVRSPKTERHAGKGRRIVPIFPALLPLLREAFEKAGTGAVYVIGTRRTHNPRTTALKIIDRAGVEAWGKPFQNLRSSCETDWASRFPIHVVCQWAGNTEAVAKGHYLQVTDAHFAAASRSDAKSDAVRDAFSPNDTLTSFDYNAKNPGFSGVFAGDQYPQGECDSDRESRLYCGVGRKAVRLAMRRMRDAAPLLYQAEIARLRVRTRGGDGTRRAKGVRR